MLGGGVLKVADKVAGYPAAIMGGYQIIPPNITELVLPNTVVTLGARAFMDCKNLKKVTIPDDASLRIIGERCFYFCTALEEINLPASVHAILEGAFAHCSSLTRIKLPDDALRLGNDLFESCTSLEQVILPSGITALRTNLFDGCSSLKDVIYGKEQRVLQPVYFNQDATRFLLFAKDTMVKMDLPNGLHVLGGITFPRLCPDYFELAMLEPDEKEVWIGKCNGIPTLPQQSYKDAIAEAEHIALMQRTIRNTLLKH